MTADRGAVLLRPNQDATLRAVARAAADTLGVPLRTARSGDGRALARQLDDSGAFTLASRVDDIAWAVVQRADKPVLLVPVPVAVDRVGPRLHRILVPLDGTADAATALDVCEPFLTDDLVVLHVFDPATAPRCWDQAGHAARAWSEEFRARWCDRPGARMELRSGPAPEQVIAVARDEGADLIVLGWSRRLEPGRAALVRRTVRDADVPILLVPTGGART